MMNKSILIEMFFGRKAEDKKFRRKLFVCTSCPFVVMSILILFISIL